MSDDCLNRDQFLPEAAARFKRAFAAGSPFPHVLVRDVFKETFLRKVRDKLLAAPFQQRRNDLFEFEQTYDLKSVSGRDNVVAQLRETLYSPSFRAWITAISGVEVNDKVDLSCSRYAAGSHLLCHDDDLAERRIAFIVYLVPEAWSQADGGTLDLFDTAGADSEAWGGDPHLITDAAGPGAAAVPAGGRSILPRRVVQRLVPAWNSLALFAVSALSHHAVAEVMAGGPGVSTGPRLSVTGWLHGAPLARPRMPAIPAPRWALPIAVADVTDGGASSSRRRDATEPPAAPPPPPAAKRARPMPQAEGRSGGAAPAPSAAATMPPPPPPPLLPVASWLSRAYLRPSVLAAARARFVEDASLALTGLLQPEVYARLRRDIGCQAWVRCGPPNMRAYSAAAGLGFPSHGLAAGDSFRGALPDGLYALTRSLAGAEFTGFLEAATGLALRAVRLEVRCFGAGDYTLLFDPAYRDAVAARKRAAREGATASSTAGADAAAGEEGASPVGEEGASPVAEGASPVSAAEGEEVTGPPGLTAVGARAAGGSCAAPSKTGKQRRRGEGAEAEAGSNAPLLQLLPLGAAEGATVLDAVLTLTGIDAAADDGGGGVPSGWSTSSGGYVSYMTSDEELLTVLPAPNALSLVLREPGVMAFVKHVSAAAPEPRFDIAMQFIVGSD